MDKYEQIEELVSRFQSGSEEAGEELIEIFTPFVNKYYKALRYGHASLKDTDIKKFIRLFQNSDMPTNQDLYKTISRVSSMCKKIDTEDLMQELTLIFLTLVKRWKKIDNTYFCHYLSTTFKWEVARKIKEMTKDPCGFSNNVSYHDAEFLDEVDINEGLGSAWIDGYTCGDIFDILSSIERTVLKLYYGDKLTDIQISNELHIPRKTCNIIRRRAITKIKLEVAPNEENNREDN